MFTALLPQNSGGFVETVGRELGGLVDMAGRNPGTATLVTALVVGLLILRALGTR